MKALKAFIKPFEAPQRNLKIKISLNFFSSSGIGTWRGKIFLNFDQFETSSKAFTVDIFL